MAAAKKSPASTRAAAPAKKPAAKVKTKAAAPARPGKKLSMAEQLPPKVELFIAEYLVDLNASRAYMASHPGVKDTTARTEGCKLLANPNVQERIAAERAKTAQRLEITREEWLSELVGIFRADVNELIQYRRLCCEACWTLAGSPTRDPNPECSECRGEGRGDVLIADTRKLSPAARALYAGVKITKEGLEVKMHSKLDAAEKIGRHLGFYEKDNEQKGKGLGEMLGAFAAGIHARQGGRLPIAPAAAPGPKPPLGSVKGAAWK